MIPNSSDRRGASPSPEEQLAALFEAHCEGVGATPLEAGESDGLKSEFLSFIERLVADVDEDDGGGLAMADSNLEIHPIGFATEEDGGILVCLELINREGESVIICADEDIPITLPAGSRAAMLYDFRPNEEVPEGSPIEERFNVCLGSILTEFSHVSECSRILNRDIDGFYGRKLSELLERYHHVRVEADSIAPAEFASPVPDTQVIRFLDSIGAICFAELGPLEPSRVNYVRSIVRFPSGASFEDAARGTPQSEALVSDFPSFYSPDESIGLIVEGEPVADDYLPALEEHFRQCFFIDWKPEWKVLATSAAFPSNSGGFCVFARVADQNSHSVLPVSNGTTAGEPLYAGFAVAIFEDRSQAEPQIGCNTFGFVLTQEFLERDLETMCKAPEKSMLSYLVYDVIDDDLVRRGIRAADQEDHFRFKELRISFLSRSNVRDTYSIHVRHDHGEHVVVLWRNTPSGLIRIGLQELDSNEGVTDFGLRYVVPPSTPLDSINAPNWKKDPQ